MIRLEHRRHKICCSSCEYVGPDTRVLVFEHRLASNKTSGHSVAVCPACATEVIETLKRHATKETK